MVLLAPRCHMAAHHNTLALYGEQATPRCHIAAHHNTLALYGEASDAAFSHSCASLVLYGKKCAIPLARSMAMLATWKARCHIAVHHNTLVLYAFGSHSFALALYGERYLWRRGITIL